VSLHTLEVEALDLGADVSAVGLDLADAKEEPLLGPEAAAVWARVLPAVAGETPWALDFFSHLDRVREYCDHHGLDYRVAAARSVVLPAPEAAALESLFARFELETFGARAGGKLEGGDAALEGDLTRHGVDAYHQAFRGYFFCAVCEFSAGSLVLLSEKLTAAEVGRRLGPALVEQDVRLVLPQTPAA
jgi:hypothetical protein